MRQGIWIALGLAFAGRAAALGFTVDNTAIDAVDVNPGDGVCAYSTAAPEGTRCTLRAAIMETNALPGPDSILLPIGATITLAIAGRNEDAGATGDLDITDGLFIAAPSALEARVAVDGGGLDRVFDIRSGAGDVTLQNLEIRNGVADDATTLAGGGIFAISTGLLRLSHCDVHDNIAETGGGVFVATANGQSLLVESSVFHGNLTEVVGVTNPFGSAIRTSDGFTETGGTVTIRNSTFHDNGGLAGTAPAAIEDSYAPIVIENSTFSDNGNTGVRVYGTTALLDHVTLTGHNVGYRFGGSSTASLSTMRNTILAGNGLDCQFGGAGYATDHAYSLDGDGSCELTGPGSLPMADPELKPLAVRYGETPVRDLAPSSPAIDAADPQLEADGGSCIATDQDGLARPIDGGHALRCDMGAVEYSGVLFADGFDG